MAKIGNNSNDLKDIKNDLQIFLNYYIDKNLNINVCDDVNGLILRKEELYNKIKNDVVKHLYYNDVFTNIFEDKLSYKLKHNEDINIITDLKIIFDKVYNEKVKNIKQQQKATASIIKDYFITDLITGAVKRLIDYTKKQYKMTDYKAIKLIDTDNVQESLYNDIIDELEAMAEARLTEAQIKKIYNDSFKSVIRNLKSRTPKEETKEGGNDNKLLNAFLFLKKW